MPHSRPQRTKTGYSIEDIIRDIKSLNSSVLLLSQKMNYLVRNEKILGRNFIILNKKLKALEQKPAVSSGNSSVPDDLNELIAELDEKIKNNSFMLNELKSDLSKLNSVYAKSEDVKELKYVVEAINPLEFVTLQQAKDLIEESKKKKK